MSNKILHRLQPQFREKMNEGFLTGTDSLDVSDFIESASPSQREIEILVNTVSSAMKKFSHAERVTSDRWLASRVHAALRLTRREASDRGIWDWLAVLPLGEYVRWRWASYEDEKVKPERYTSSDMNRQAIARLWWGAELTRNGDDYSATEILFSLQDIQNVWSVARFFRNRPVAIAALKFLETYNDGRLATGNQAKTLGKAFKSILTTTVLDSVATGQEVDVSAVRTWVSDTNSWDETKWDTELPKGPPEQKCNDSQIVSATELLQHLVAVTNFGEESSRSEDGEVSAS